MDTNKSTVPGERLCTVISYVQHKILGGSLYWVLVVYQTTKYKWSVFVKHKSDMARTIVEIVKEIKVKHQKQVRYIRCDNAGENLLIEKEIITNKIKNINIKFTAPRTPEQNGIVERAFSVFYNRVRAMLNRAGFETGMMRQMRAECENMAVQLDNIHIRNDNLSTYERFHNKNLNEWNEMRGFGEIVVVKTSESLQRKLKNKGSVVMMVGYCESHGKCTYCFYNIEKEVS